MLVIIGDIVLFQEITATYTTEEQDGGQAKIRSDISCLKNSFSEPPITYF